MGSGGAAHDELIAVCAMAVRAACRRMTPPYLKALGDSIGQACDVPAGMSWDRRAAAHTEIINLLADTAANPALGVLLRDVPGHLHHLMVTAGPACSEAILSSRRRLLTLMRAGDAEGAAGEMEQHLRCLARMRGPVPGSPAGLAV
jgi:GntR family transcriptional regulator, transcriptional repressor for pyruvate dehydrogenase complex